jgi:hypothetical protein
MRQGLSAANLDTHFSFFEDWRVLVSVCFHILATYAERLQNLYSACLMLWMHTHTGPRFMWVESPAPSNLGISKILVPDEAQTHNLLHWRQDTLPLRHQLSRMFSRSIKLLEPLRFSVDRIDGCIHKQLAWSTNQDSTTVSASTDSNECCDVLSLILPSCLVYGGKNSLLLYKSDECNRTRVIFVLIAFFKLLSFFFLFGKCNTSWTTCNSFYLVWLWKLKKCLSAINNAHFVLIEFLIC